MSRIIAELSGNELIIQNIERHRKGDNDIQIINLEDLKLNKQYKSEVKVSSSKQLNKIIFMQEISNEFALSISIKKAKLLITDYSSIAYNSFYQGTGVIFYQPDLRLYERENGKLIPNDDG